MNVSIYQLFKTIFSIFFLLTVLYSNLFSQSKQPAKNNPITQRNNQTNANTGKFPTPLKPSQSKSIYEKFGYNSVTEKQWLYILEVFEKYDQLTVKDIYSYNVFAKQMLGIAKISYNNRIAKKRWAGDFVLISFITAALDLEENTSNWVNDPIFMNFNELNDLGQCFEVLGVKIDKNIFLNIILDEKYSKYRGICSTYLLGKRHINGHLIPTFKLYVNTLLHDIAKNAPKENRYRMIVDALLNLRKEHINFIESAVKPAFDNNPQLNDWLGSIQKSFAKWNVSNDVTNIREQTVKDVLLSLKENQLITVEEVEKIFNNHDTCKCVY